ncbi:hypothetical protein [Tolypothrix sp. NIES-4075]|uniref:hypothetical protein n=1 Tax=Tolypothrix sp. NIES-4075 TaxID=2005459 RepID=UPI00117BE878|nr:hypothetical protein [Tolypothrix sp. NIES-4075]
MLEWEERSLGISSLELGIDWVIPKLGVLTQVAGYRRMCVCCHSIHAIAYKNHAIACNKVAPPRI